MTSKQHTSYAAGRTISGAGFVPFSNKYPNQSANYGQPIGGHSLAGQAAAFYPGYPGGTTQVQPK